MTYIRIGGGRTALRSHGRSPTIFCRRDFTMNAMAYSPQRGLVDIFGGREHIDKGLIVCVGDARERFREDALRILRALRFASLLNFKIEESAAVAINEESRFSGSSAERYTLSLQELSWAAPLRKSCLIIKT